VIPAISKGVIPAQRVLQSEALSLKRNERTAPFWLLVAALLLIRFALNRFHLQRIAQHSVLIRDLRFLELAHELWLKSEAFLRPRVAVSRNVAAPVSFNAGGIWILLPEDWPNWGEAKLRAVLAHEMSHVRRDDSAHLQFASLVTCIFWFHPLSWFLRLSAARVAGTDSRDSRIYGDCGCGWQSGKPLTCQRSPPTRKCGKGRGLAVGLSSDERKRESYTFPDRGAGPFPVRPKSQSQH